MSVSDSIISLLSKALSRWKQSERLLRLHTPLGGDVLLPEAVRGLELIGPDPRVSGFRLVVTALSIDAQLDELALMGQPVLLELQTQTSREILRPFHGHVTRFERLGANGGFARYRLCIEPWAALLAHNQDAFVFQDKTVIEIVDAVFSRWQSQGKLMPQWRWELSDASIYPKRSMCCQYQESDLAFVSRLLAEEGIYYWFEHQGDAASASLGLHTLVLADHNAAFKTNAQSHIRFTRADATEKADSIQKWSPLSCTSTNGVELASWDYRTLATRPARLNSSGSAESAARKLALSHRLEPGQYAYPDNAGGERLARVHLESVEASRKRFGGQGTVRTLAPATTFTLTDHPDCFGASEQNMCFVVLGIQHVARNNFNEDMRGAIGTILGELDVADPEAQDADSAHYQNSFTALQSTTPYHVANQDDHGRRLYARPAIHGMQTAIVVGPAGAPIHTDRDGRIKVQFHWQRGSQSASRLAHPSGEDNAPGTDAIGVWVRVGQSYVGANFGAVMIPRVGQEVGVSFIEGDIDRPVVTGALYNGRGEADAQHNQVSFGGSQATGNAPAWFAGEEGAHGHNAVLSGYKTMEMHASQTGAGGYNQLVIDDTPGEGGIRLATTQSHTSLQLGHLKYHRDNARQSSLGHGAELTTAAWGAVRGGCGMLISADARPDASGTLLDAKEAQTQLDAATQLAQTLAQNAQQQNAKLKGEPAPDQLPAIQAMVHSKGVLETTAEGRASSPTKASDTDESSSNANPAIQGGTGTVPAWSEPFLVTSAPAGVAILTPKSATLNSGATYSITTGQDLNILSQQSTVINAAKGLAFYTYGKAKNAQKPNQETGIKLHAASGKVSLQSQSDKTQIAADKQVTLASAQSTVTLAAPSAKLQLIAAGAGITIEGGNITLKAPGTVTVGGAMTVFAGPQSSSESVNLQKGGPVNGCAESLREAAGIGGALV